MTASITSLELELRRGEAPGTFSDDPPYTRPLAGTVDELIAGAIDQETHGDLVVVYSGLNQLSILLWAQDEYAAIDGMPLDTGMGPRRPAILNLDGDGLPDVAFATMMGVETFTSITPDGAAPGLFPVEHLDDLARVSYDGADALLAVHYSLDTVAVYRVSSRPGEIQQLRDAQIDQAGHAIEVDFHQDGDADVLVVGEDSRVWLLPSFLERNDGELAMIGSFEGMGAPERIAIGQLDGECGLDLAVLANGDGTESDVVMMRYDNEELSAGFLLGLPSTNAIQISDLAADGGTEELVLAHDMEYVQIARYLP